MLTKQQHDLLMLIHKSITDKGVCPSYQEMMEAMNLHSKSGIHRIISALEERGFIRKLENKARAVEILKMPSAAAPKESTVVPFSGAAVKTAQIPLYGKIAAGTPIEAIADTSRFADVPPSMIGGGDYYALEIDGESMQDIGIMDGDTVMIERCQAARNGDIVVALVNDEEATLKRFKKDGDTVYLIPENTEHSIQKYHASQVKIQGRLVGLTRVYH